MILINFYKKKISKIEWFLEKLKTNFTRILVIKYLIKN